MAVQDPIGARRALLMALMDLPKLATTKALADEIQDRLVHDEHDNLGKMTINGMFDFMDQAAEVNLKAADGSTPTPPTDVQREAVVHAVEDELIHQTALAIAADFGIIAEPAIEAAIRQNLTTQGHGELDDMALGDAIDTMVDAVQPALKQAQPNFQGLSDAQKEQVVQKAVRGFEVTVALSIANRLVPPAAREPGGLPNPGGAES